MPVHDWTRVSAGTFHDFHSSWITHLKESLNAGVLPEGYYAMAEQHAGRVITDILTLEGGEESRPVIHRGGAATVAEALPKVQRKLVASPMAAYRAQRRTIAIRHTSGHRVVALLEIVSLANKDRPQSVADFVKKAQAALQHDCHLLIVDLLPPGRHDPQGMHGAIWEAFDPDEATWPEDKPITLAAYEAATLPEAHLVAVAMGEELPPMPLFLDVGWAVSVPLESTYQTAYHGMPAFWRNVLEGKTNP